jgi:hypothetical protein
VANLTADLDTRCGELYPPGGELLPDREVGSDAAAVSASSLPPGDRAAVPGLVSSREPFEVLVCFLDGTDAAGLSADGKGILMRPDALRSKTATKAARAGPEPKTRLSRGEKLAHKRMAEIGAV